MRWKRLDRLVSLRELVERVMPSLKDADVAKLDAVAAGWAGVVGPELARRSRPFDLVGSELSVAVDGPHAASGIVRMRGNIVRGLKRKWGLEVEELRVVNGPPPNRPKHFASAAKRRKPEAPPVDPDELEALKARCPLPDSLASTLARFLLSQEKKK